MNRQRTNTNARKTPPRGRRGLVVGLMLVMIVFLSGFLAVGVNAIRLRQVQSQLRNVCRTAALAGASELIDEGVLYNEPGVTDDKMAARLAACGFAQVNPVDGGFIRLDPNDKNDPTGDVVVGYVDPSGPVGQPIELNDKYGANTVRVTARMSKNAANRVTLWFGNIVGLTTVDVAVSAQASVDQRIVGFRPEPGVKAPVAPMIAEYGPWMKQAEAAATQLNDQYSVDPLTGAVTQGADGIPEIVVTAGAQQSGETQPAQAAVDKNGGTTADDETMTDDEEGSTAAGRCVALRLYNELNLPYIWPVRAREGLSLGDLRDYGGMLVIRNGVTPVGIENVYPDELSYGLMDAIGQVRAWPLGEPSSNDSSSWSLTGFGAGRVCAVRRVDGGLTPTWYFVIQPATLVSSQAVADVGGVSNPWIAKLELTQ